MICDSCARAMGRVGTFEQAGLRLAAFECAPCHRGVVVPRRRLRAKPPSKRLIAVR